MKLTEWFKKFFLTEAMSVEQAFKALGLEYGDYDGVDKAFKKLAMKYHPDRGGDAEKMKEINSAKEILGDRKGSTRTTFSKDDWAKTKAKRDAEDKRKADNNQALVDKLFNDIKPFLDSYSDYFQQVTGDTYKFSSSVKAGAWRAILSAKWLSEKKDKYFTMTFDVRWKEDNFSLGGATVKEYEADYTSFMFLAGKKVKLTQKRWNTVSFDAKDYEKPDKIFPESKIKKSLALGGDKPIKRADFEVFLVAKFEGHSNGDRDWVYLPLGEKKVYPHAVAIHRSVIMRQASWHLRGLAGLVGTPPDVHYTTGAKTTIKTPWVLIPETRKGMAFLEKVYDLCKEISEGKKQPSALSDLYEKEKDELYK